MAWFNVDKCIGEHATGEETWASEIVVGANNRLSVTIKALAPLSDFKLTVQVPFGGKADEADGTTYLVTEDDNNVKVSATGLRWEPRQPVQGERRWETTRIQSMAGNKEV